MIKITQGYSDGVAAEELAWEERAPQYYNKLSDTNSVEEYALDGLSIGPKQYQKLVELLDGKCKILDVGVGAGQSSMFLASLGHSVFALEPVQWFCELIEKSAKKFSADITVVYGVGEDIENIGEQFDAIFFNASLHHCDDPKKALLASYNCLRERKNLPGQRELSASLA